MENITITIIHSRDYPGDRLVSKPPLPDTHKIPSRVFAGPHQCPPTDFAAYGILAFPSRSSPYDRERHLMFCNVYVATFPYETELEVNRAEQMVTVWPLDTDIEIVSMSLRNSQFCERAVNLYNLVIARQAIKEAKLARLDIDSSGIGPFLLAWSPSTEKGKPDATVLAIDLSDVTSYEQAMRIFLDWADKIESDHTSWSNRWGGVRGKLRQFVDRYGPKMFKLSR